MKNKSVTLTVASVLLLAAAAFPSDVTTVAKLGSGYQGNLFSDSSELGDAYGSVGLDMQYYPSGFARFSGQIRYDAYSTYTDLSNLSGQLSTSFIPTKQTSPLSIMISGSAALRRFGPLYQMYDQNGFTTDADLSYRLAPSFYLLGSFTFAHTSYVHSDYGSSTGYDLSVGTSLTLFGSNSLALTGQYTDRSNDQPSITTTGTGMGMGQNENSDPTFQIYGATVRYSRPFGERTGLNLTVAHRGIEMGDDLVLYGYSIDYLSPWSDLWEGTSIAAGLKHFFPHQWLVGINAGYYDKSFAPIVDADESGNLTYWSDTRSDHLTSVSLSITRPITLNSGSQLTPTLSTGYRRNQSNIAYYDYDDIWTSLSLNVSL